MAYNDTLEKFCELFLSVRHQVELPKKLECPKLQVFSLELQKNFLKIPDSFFEVMTELKVLYLCECTLADIAIVGEFTNLEILTVHDSDIKQLPSAIGRLHRLKLLDLRGCNSLKVIPPRVVSKLTRLEEVNMECSFTNWEVKGQDTRSRNCSLSEIKWIA
ncbi:Disease resistance protein [Quillaja saponaria]|uniref:Disease resistance protein n=1 Tax=Quillaja saponaria TaxID=32244 RepID=A0AAD7LQ77_QUISA|nr:Disease resistance protein [Quillaja saponaria]